MEAFLIQSVAFLVTKIILQLICPGTFTITKATVSLFNSSVPKRLCLLMELQFLEIVLQYPVWIFMRSVGLSIKPN
jgi:hypothetical protein